MIKTCPKCQFENKDFTGAVNSECPSCGIIYAKFAAQSRDPKNMFRKVELPSKDIPAPAISTVCYVLAVFGFMVCTYVGISLFPLPVNEFSGFRIMMSLGWMSAGVVQGGLFWALGSGLKYLNGLYQVAISDL